MNNQRFQNLQNLQIFWGATPIQTSTIFFKNPGLSLPLKHYNFFWITKIDQSIFELPERNENAKNVGGQVATPFPSPPNLFLQSLDSPKIYGIHSQWMKGIFSTFLWLRLEWISNGIAYIWLLMNVAGIRQHIQCLAQGHQGKMWRIKPRTSSIPELAYTLK